MKNVSTGRFIRGLVLCLFVGLAGCVWFRLLEIKNQLADFDENIRVEVVERHFILKFLNPVLLSDDFVYLSKLRPSRIETLAGGGYRWFLDFHLDPNLERDLKSRIVSFSMTWTQKHKLTAFGFSPLFLEMAPPAFLEASIRSLGVGKVDQDKKQLKVDPEDLPRITARLPRLGDITRVMGPPLERKTEDGLMLLVYRFKADASPVDKEYEDRKIAEARLYFDIGRDELVRLKGRFAGLKLSIDYRKLMAASGGDDPVE